MALTNFCFQRKFVILFLLNLCVFGTAVNAQNNSFSQEIMNQKLMQRLDNIENKILDLEKNKNVTEDDKLFKKQLSVIKNDLNKLSSNITATAINLAGKESSMSSQYMQVIFLLLTFFAVVWYLVFKVLHREITDKVIEEADQHIKKIVSEHTEYSGLLVRGDLYLQTAYSWYRIFEPEYQELIQSKGNASVELKSYTANAQTLVTGGLKDLFSHGSILYNCMTMKDDLECYRLFLCLKNDWVYHRTAEIVCKGERSSCDICEVIDIAEWCLSSLETKQGGKLESWYCVHQTVGQSMILLGSEGQKQRGRQIISDLLKGNFPKNRTSPALKWSQDVWRKCFIEQNGATHDVFGLGEIELPNK